MDWNKELLDAALAGDAARVKAALAEGAQLDVVDKLGNTALIWAARYGRTEAVTALIEAGAALDAGNNNGDTALMWAAQFGNPEAVTALIEAGAELDARNNDGFTALIWAAWYDSTEVVTTLIEAGAELGARNTDGDTALILAAANGNTEVVTTLIEAGAQLDAGNNVNGTALMWAARYDRRKALTALIEAGAALDAGNKDGDTALIWAAQFGNPVAVTALIEAGADASVTNQRGIRAADHMPDHPRLAAATRWLDANPDGQGFYHDVREQMRLYNEAGFHTARLDTRAAAGILYPQSETDPDFRIKIRVTGEYRDQYAGMIAGHLKVAEIDKVSVLPSTGAAGAVITLSHPRGQCPSRCKFIPGIADHIVDDFRPDNYGDMEKAGKNSGGLVFSFWDNTVFLTRNPDVAGRATAYGLEVVDHDSEFHPKLLLANSRNPNPGKCFRIYGGGLLNFIEEEKTRRQVPGRG